METPILIIIAIAFILLFWLFAVTVRECDNLRRENADLHYDINKLKSKNTNLINELLNK